MEPTITTTIVGPTTPQTSNSFTVYYRRPESATPILVRTSRVYRRARYHIGARVGSGPLLLPEACNLDQAVNLEERGPLTDDPTAVADGDRCRRCFG